MSIDAVGTRQIKGLGLGYDLTKSIIAGGYSCEVSDGKTASDVLSELLSYQEVETITFGGVSAILDVEPIAVEIQDGTDIWTACKTVRNTVGGYLRIEIDSDVPSIRELWLHQNIGDDTGQQIRVGKNLASIKRTRDYIDLCNRLYPIGDAGLKLDTLTYTRQTGDISMDVSNAYLTLRGQYTAYKDWTGEGDAVPGNVTIEKPTGSWFSPNPFDSHQLGLGNTLWWFPEKTYDGNIGTSAYSILNPGQTTKELQLLCPPTNTTSVRVYLSGSSMEGIAMLPIIVRVRIGGVWTTIYSGYPGSEAWREWFEISFPESEITGLGLSAYNWSSFEVTFIWHESDVWDISGYDNDTANWKQGADERTLRIPIGDYDAVPYVVSYTHAPYLIALDGITDRRQIKSHSKSFNSTDIDALLALGRKSLGESLNPVSSINIDMIDLSTIEGFEFDQIQLGNIIHVIHEALGIDESQRVVRVRWPDLFRPQLIQVELANKTKDIIDSI